MATPKIIPYTVKLRSVVPEKTFSKPPVVYTNDLRSAEFQFKITDMDASELLTATAKTMLYMRDGSFFQNPSTDVSRVGNVFSYLLKENEGNHAGIAKIQLVVYFNEGLANEQNFPTQLYEFEIINGLETKVAQEVMIYDWTTLTRDARAYIDQFVADEVFRDAQFENAQFDRNVAFVSSQESRALAFGVEQTNRGTAFTAEQNERTTAFNESESGRTTGENGRVTAESNRVTAESGRVTKESQRVTAESSRVTVESGRVTAESGRVTAENARVTAETNRAATFNAFNTRLTAEETATANNKISSVKGKTFADVDARLEDVEFDTAMMGTNLITNGDFSNGTTGWVPYNATIAIENGRAKVQPTGQWATIGKSLYGVTIGKKFYFRVDIEGGPGLYWGNTNVGFGITSAVNKTFAAVITATSSDITVGVGDNKSSSWPPFYVDNLLLIDLTAAFGAGNEPTAEQMDGILAKFTNSWFNGTANLFRANATLNKLMAIDARTEFDAKNEVVNGGGSTTLAAATNTSTTVQTFAQPLPENNKYYVRYNVISTGASNTRNTMLVEYADATTFIHVDSLNGNITTGAKSWLFTTTKQVKFLKWWHHTLDVPTVIEKIALINLTAAFGVGKEPTLAEMDRLMARFPNSWFDGVKPIQTIETLYQEKANKTQEAWLTPTLVNGFTSATGHPVRYFKDEFGIVRLAGRIVIPTTGMPAVYLPAGYRPSVEQSLPVLSIATGTVVTRLTVNTDGGLRFYGTAAEVSLYGIGFALT